MIRGTRNLLAVLFLATLGAALVAGPALAAAPAWRVESLAAPSHLVPGVTNGENMYLVIATNTGGAATDGSTVTITDNLPAGFSAQPNNTFTCSVLVGIGNLCLLNFGIESDADFSQEPNCDPGPPVTCTLDHTVVPGERIRAYIPLQAPASGPATVTNQVTVSGGGAAQASATERTPFTADPAPFGFQHAKASLTDPAGSPATQAGAHPYSFRLGFDTNSDVRHFENAGDAAIYPSEGPKDVVAKLPPGLAVNPTATPKCTEVQLEISDERARPTCPNASVVGLAQPTSNVFTFPAILNLSLYNMVAPPSAPAEFAFNVLGFYFHPVGGIDPANNYSLQATGNDLTSFGEVSGVTVDLWGDPSDHSHDGIRGTCGGDSNGGTYTDNTCPVLPDPVPFLTMPTSCSNSLSVGWEATSWQSGAFASTSAETKDGYGDGANLTPTGVTGCDSLDFNPSLQARPTTTTSDSPSGLNVDLQIPQNESQNTLATAHLKKAVVTLPQGLVLNPSAANGLEACTSSEIGIDPNTGMPNGNHPTCPDASKLGTVEVDTPLLDNPLPGSVYLAKPHDNPFGSQLAIYIAIDDPQTGVIVKLPGKVQADPYTGQLVTTFDNNPQLPFSEFKLNFFGGATGALRTPDSCGDYSTTSELTPWSSSTDTPVTPPDDTYSIDQGPRGDCPAPADQPNSPSFDAGTVVPTAGTFSPFVLHLNRDDGTQQFSQVTLSPPAGMVAKLAGTPACSEAGIAQAQNRSASGDGALEQSDPSCPAASKVGTVDVAAGAGPSPVWVKGNVYLAGPYKGSPLSFVIITPAVAGPFDLGVVVTRAAIAIDPTTAQITATADPIPDHLTVDGNGFSLDVRSVQMKLDKPSFTLNGTSCDKTSINGSLLSTLGQTASLAEPFQLAECVNLGFKPSLALSLKGGHFRNGHPALTSTLSFPSGAFANLAKAQVTLPPGMQLDQSHIQAPCTRPQFAAGQCPAASVIGTVTATSPLLDYALTGPVYLRTGNNPLPDVVLDLHGPPSQPIEIDQVGKIDTVNARLRTTFEGVPDAPITKAVISLVGGSKGLLVNNANLCKQTNRASVFLDGHDNATADSTPKVAIKCPKPRKRHPKHHKRHRRHHG